MKRLVLLRGVCILASTALLFTISFRGLRHRSSLLLTVSLRNFAGDKDAPTKVERGSHHLLKSSESRIPEPVLVIIKPPPLMTPDAE